MSELSEQSLILPDDITEPTNRSTEKKIIKSL